MTKIKSASFTRYTRVMKLLQTDPLLSKELSKEMVAVCRPDQTSQDFPQEVVYVVDKIHAQGLDANTCTGKDILKFAFDLLVTNRGPITFAPEVTVPAKKSAAKKSALAAVAEEPDEQPAPAPVSKAKSKAAPAPKATSGALPPVVAVNNAGAAVKSADRTAKVVAVIRPGIPNVISCAGLSNIQAALSLFEAVAGNDAVLKDICQRLNTIIDEVHRNTILPSAKENSETAAG